MPISQQAGDLDHIVAVAEAQRGGAERLQRHARGRSMASPAAPAHDLEEGLVRAPVFLRW
jgi:hypothetical protein